MVKTNHSSNYEIVYYTQVMYNAKDAYEIVYENIIHEARIDKS